MDEEKRRLKDQSWYPNLIVACAAVTLHFAMTHFKSLYGVLFTLGGYLYPLIVGAVIAYLVNPLMKWYQNFVFQKVKQESVRKGCSVASAVLSIWLALLILLNTLVPQLVSSVTTFVSNLDIYTAALKEWLKGCGSLRLYAQLQGILDSSQNLIDRATSFISNNSGEILSMTASIGSHISAWLIGAIFAIYFLSEKDKLKTGAARLLKAILKQERYSKALPFLQKCDEILSRYIIFSLLDGTIVGIVNAVAMTIMGMPYVGLVSVIVGVTNLIPTFGPIIGAVIGAFILLLVNPTDVIGFLILTLVLQTVDGYIIKPKLFGDTFGVSGLWILAAVVVGGRVFGVIGILLAIPSMAILDYLYHEWFLPRLEKG